MFYFLVAIAIGYGLGSIPSGKYYAWYFRGIDIQKIGSGRTGGTNSIRAGGWTLGFMTAFSDVLKGIFVIIVTRWVLGDSVSADMLPWLEVTAGIFSVVGHNWSMLAGFRGGAGTGPNIGWSSAVYPPLFIYGFSIMFSGIFIFGRGSVASIAMALLTPVAFAYLYFTGSTIMAHHPAYTVGGVITLFIILFALRKNIVRLWRGEERVVGLPAYLAKRRRHNKMSRNELQPLADLVDPLDPQEPAESSARHSAA